ncbi:MAG: tetratricopeptide repeat protein [Alphaproteobacteria bacterium]
MGGATRSNHPVITTAFDLHNAGRHDEAAAVCHQVLTTAPDDVEALHLLGLMAMEAGDRETARHLLGRAMAVNPASVRLRYTLGRLCMAEDRLSDAVTHFKVAVHLAPGHQNAYCHLGRALLRLNRFAEARVALLCAVEINPDFVAALTALAEAYLRLRNDRDAADCLRRALSRDPNHAPAHDLWANIVMSDHRPSEAERHLRIAIALAPQASPPLANLASCLMAQARIGEARVAYEDALRLGPMEPGLNSAYCFCLSHDPAATAGEILAEHRRWDAIHAAPLASLTAPAMPSVRSGERLRVGYVSPDFCKHPVAWFFGPVLAAHDRAKVEIFCYSDVALPDGITEELRRTAEHWRDLTGSNNEAAAATIRGDGIDILVDLAGHTGGNRLLTFARKPAPVQASWLGYLGGTGVAAIDWRISDGFADPVEVTDEFCSERVMRLPGAFLCLTPPANAPDVRPGPGERGEPVVFGCFNKLHKINDQVITLWVRILARVPDSRLLLKAAGLGDASLREGLAARFAAHGIAAERIVMTAYALDHAHHLALFGDMDIALDPFPWNGGTTTCEALWMGVPLVTLNERRPFRMGAGLLTAAGLPEMIAASPEEYVDIAVALAEDTPRRRSLRAGMRARLLASPLLDPVGFTRGLEEAFAAMWRDYMIRSGEA